MSAPAFPHVEPAVSRLPAGAPRWRPDSGETDGGDHRRPTGMATNSPNTRLAGRVPGMIFPGGDAALLRALLARRHGVVRSWRVPGGRRAVFRA